MVVKEGVRYFPYSCGIWNERGQGKKTPNNSGGGGEGLPKSAQEKH